MENNIDKTVQASQTPNEEQRSEEDDLQDYEFLESIYNNQDKIQELLKSGTLPPKIKDFLSEVLNKLKEAENKSNSNFENAKFNKATYEMRAKLRYFRPCTWRRFIISGNTTIAKLEVAILKMFHADFEHMYDLYNLKTKEQFQNDSENDDLFTPWEIIDPKKAKVSYLNENDKLLLTYDYGDGWEFEAKIRKIDQQKPAPKHPEVLSGKGYGIIDDIGGVDALQEIYDTPEKKLDPDLLDWLGGKKINLDEFDKDELNETLKDI